MKRSLLIILFQTGRTDTKADKMVFELKSKWIIIDIEELHKYIKEQKEKEVNLDDLLEKLEWEHNSRKILGINISHNPSICIYSNF